MADFVQVMNDWARMCASRHGGLAKCDNCPLFKVLCQYRPNEKVDLVGAEEIIEKWAEDNPEPVYPTWLEWLESLGLGIVYRDGYDTNGVKGWAFSFKKAEKPIPADLAQKLGLQPKK